MLIFPVMHCLQARVLLWELELTAAREQEKNCQPARVTHAGEQEGFVTWEVDFATILRGCTILPLLFQVSLLVQRHLDYTSSQDIE